MANHRNRAATQPAAAAASACGSASVLAYSWCCSSSPPSSTWNVDRGWGKKGKNLHRHRRSLRMHPTAPTKPPCRWCRLTCRCRRRPSRRRSHHSTSTPPQTRFMSSYPARTISCMIWRTKIRKRHVGGTRNRRRDPDHRRRRLPLPLPSTDSSWHKRIFFLIFFLWKIVIAKSSVVSVFHPVQIHDQFSFNLGDSLMFLGILGDFFENWLI